VVVDPRHFRPAEVDHLQADPRKAAAKLGWRPSVDFLGLVKMMVRAEIAPADSRHPVAQA